MVKFKVTDSSGKAVKKIHHPSPKSKPLAADASYVAGGPNGHENGHSMHPNGEPSSNGKAAHMTEKVKELLRLAQEQGYLTYNDINDALPDSMINPEDLDELYIKLRSLEVEIVDQAEVDRVKQPEVEEDEKTRLDILDDPVRMYLK